MMVKKVKKNKKEKDRERKKKKKRRYSPGFGKAMSKNIGTTIWS